MPLSNNSGKGHFAWTEGDRACCREYKRNSNVSVFPDWRPPMPFLQFKGKTSVETYHHSLPHHTLQFDASRSLLGVEQEPSLEGNLIIEGDNLLALKALL